MNSGVANPGCERTAGKITRCSNVVNRTLAFFDANFRFSCERSIRARNHSQHGDRVDVDRQLDAMRGGMLPGDRVRQRQERPRVRTAQLEVKPIKVADLDDRGRRRSEDADGRSSRRAKCRREVVHVGGNRRFLRPSRDQPHDPAVRGHAVFFSLGQLAPGEPLDSREWSPSGSRGGPASKSARAPDRADRLARCVRPPAPQAGRSARRPGNPADEAPCRR